MKFNMILSIVKDCVLPLTALCISIAAMYISLKQKKISEKQYCDDHERTRRTNTVDILFKWTDKLTAKNATARKFAESLSEENLMSIIECKSFTIANTPHNRRCVEILNENCKLEDDAKEIKIDSVMSTKLRWELVSYLNALEFVLVGWIDNVVDKDIIEQEFEYLFDHYNGGLRTVRKITRGCYPCIDAFEEEMLKKRTNILKKKIQLGRESAKCNDDL